MASAISAFAETATGDQAQSAQAAIKLACIGNSITSGSIAGVNPYPVYLHSLLGSGYQVENDGVSGTTLLKKGDSPYWTHGKLSNVFAFKPAIITIKLGTNDSKPYNWKYKSEFGTDLNALIDTLYTISPKPVIWLCLPVPAWPVNGANSYDIDGIVIANEVIPIIKQVAEQRNLDIIDLHTALSGMRSHFADGVHPDAVGQDTIAHVIYRALTAPVTALSGPSVASARSWLPEIGLLNGRLRVQALPSDAIRFSLLDMSGRILESWMVPKGGAHEYSFAGLPSGPYLLTMDSPLGRAAKRLEFIGH